MHPLRRLREAGPPSPQQVAEILAENVVMHSPVLIKPIVGRELVAITISNSSHSRDNPGKYIYEGKLDDRTTLLRWRGTVEGHEIESLELLTDNEQGLLLERTIANRLKRREAASRYVGVPRFRTGSTTRKIGFIQNCPFRTQERNAL